MVQSGLRKEIWEQAEKRLAHKEDLDSNWRTTFYFPTMQEAL